MEEKKNPQWPLQLRVKAMVTRVFESCFLFLNFVPSSSTSDGDMLCINVPSVLFKIRVTIYWVSNM